MRAANLKSDSDNQLALQLAHDIASPLMVMQLNIRFIKDILPKERLSMMQAAINQIREITHSVLNKNNVIAKINLVSIVEQIIIEKKYIWKNYPCDIEFIEQDKTKEYAIYAVNADIYRMLSNLLNNAYESLGEKGKIIIGIDESEDRVVLNIIDSGCGIPANKIDAVLQGESLKINGHGVGLSSAFRYMKSIGGDLVLRSSENKGTEVRLVFSKCT